jgi:hypothetical protein
MYGWADLCCCDCGKAKPGAAMVCAWWASGSLYYCQECWPKHRDFYVDATGREIITREQVLRDFPSRRRKRD